MKVSKDEFENELALTLKELPQEPPAGSAEQLEKNGIFENDYLIYSVEWVFDPLQDRTRRFAACHCTACGEKTYLEYEKIERPQCAAYATTTDTVGFVDPIDHGVKTTGDACVCPSCGKGMKAMHVSHFGRSPVKEIDRCFCISVHQVRGHLALLGWSMIKNADRTGGIKYSFLRYSGMLVICGKKVRLAGFRRWWGAVEGYPCWNSTKRFDEKIGYVQKGAVIKFDPRTIFDSECEKSGLEEYLKKGFFKSGDEEVIYPGAYLTVWVRYPQVENLIRNGYARLATEALKKATYRASYYNSDEIFREHDAEKYFDFKHKKPSKILGLDKAEFASMKSWTLDEIELYKAFRDEKNERLSHAEIKAYMKKYGGLTLKKFVESAKLGVPAKLKMSEQYLLRQKEKVAKERARKVTLGYLTDYWQMTFDFYGEVPQSMIFPKNIINAHDDMMLRIKVKEDPEINKKISARAKKLESMSFESVELLIRPCRTHGELIKEGLLLNHCVAGYAKDVASGKTNIFFIRKKDEPDTPYYTLEWCDGKIIQDHGYDNRLQTKEIKEFEQKWLDFLGGKEDGKCIASA